MSEVTDIDKEINTILDEGYFKNIFDIALAVIDTMTGNGEIKQDEHGYNDPIDVDGWYDEVCHQTRRIASERDNIKFLDSDKTRWEYVS